MLEEWLKSRHVKGCLLKVLVIALGLLYIWLIFNAEHRYFLYAIPATISLLPVAIPVYHSIWIAWSLPDGNSMDSYQDDTAASMNAGDRQGPRDMSDIELTLKSLISPNTCFSGKMTGNIERFASSTNTR